MNMILTTTNGHTFQIDEDDYDKVSAYSWTKPCDGYIKKYREKLENGKRIRWVVLAHRLIMNARSNEIVDHINGDTTDNRKVNLRVASRSLNALNTSKVKGAVPYRGVSFNKQCNRYMARLTYNKHTEHLGFFDTAEEAAIAYNNRKEELSYELQLHNR